MSNMKVEFTNEDVGEAVSLDSKVENNTDLKNWLVGYVGEKSNPENKEVTVGHIVETMAKEFPEFLWAVAEENWIRGYQQALQDVEVGQGLYDEISKDSENETNRE